MDNIARRFRVPAITLLLACCVLFPFDAALQAGRPHGAYYSADNSRVFWFIHVSDLHIGASGTTDSTRLNWIVTTARSVINPQFIVATGDLTDSTNGNVLGYPNGPYQAEWTQYKTILANAGAGPDFFYDLPGNHDAYSDKNFAYYLANSVQGSATGKTQLSWTRAFDFGTYHFLGVNTADNTGAAFSLVSPYGDHAGLDATELAYIQAELGAHTDADLTLVFGHHPVTATGNSSDTYLYYGHQEFIAALDTYGASTYNYGHTHVYSQALFKGDSYTGVMSGDGIHYDNVASLGKSSGSYYSIVAIDCNGVSSITPSTNAWPVVLITAPVDRHIGGAENPYAYTVPASSTNPIRALVFDSGPISSVSYRIDSGATWHPMTRVGTTPLWETATWDASALVSGDHTVEVRAVGTTTVSNAITVNVTTTTNPLPAAGDFTGDLKSDILWRHDTQGDVWLWPMNGAARVSETYVRTVAGTDWEIRGLGDQNGDGMADILWRNKTSGEIYFWPMNGATRQAETYVATVDPAYDIVGTGDFNGDGKLDILWRHTTRGDVWIWLMNGATPLSEVYVGRVDPGYVVKGVGDIDGDRKADIVWHHATSGEVWVWLMNGATRLSQTRVATVPDTGYQIQGVADFTGDRKADILWHHATRGEVWIWTMNGTTRLAETWVGTVPDTGYQIVGTGDYNGDAKADILWHHATRGEVWVWLMDGTTKLSETRVATVADLGYQIIKVK
jgi:hypothetical protein